jgi:hypothetical protein
VNAMLIESGDCWAAEPDYSMELDVAEGRLKGGMCGVSATPQPCDPSRGDVGVHPATGTGAGDDITGQVY